MPCYTHILEITTKTCTMTYLTYFLLSLWRIGPRTTPLHSVFPLLHDLHQPHDLKPSSLSSLYTVLLQVSFGLPLLRFPSGVQVNAVLTCLFLSIRSTCPIHLHLLLLMMVLISSIPALSLTVSFRTLCGQ